MRKIEQGMCRALRNGTDYKRDNTRVAIRRDEDGNFHSAVVYLHGNEIAHYYRDNTLGEWLIRLTDAGWQTRTTFSRLNALMSEIAMGRVHIYMKDYVANYTLGNDKRGWQGTHTFFAFAPRTSN